MIPTSAQLVTEAATGAARLTFDILVNGSPVTTNLGALTRLEIEQNAVEPVALQVDRQEELVSLAEEEVRYLEGQLDEGEPSETLTNALLAAESDVRRMEEILEQYESVEETREAAVEAAEAALLTADAEFRITGGTLVQDMSRPIRRNVSIGFAGGRSTVPVAITSGWSPANRADIQAYWRSPSGSARYLIFKMQGPSYTYDLESGTFEGTITGVDRLGWLSEIGFDEPFQVLKGESPELAVFNLLQEVDGASGPVVLTARQTALGGNVSFGLDKSVLDVVVELSAEGGFEVRTTPQGRLLIAYPLLAGRRSSFHTFSPTSGYVRQVGRGIDTESIVNGAIVSTNNLDADDDPVTAALWITSGPLAYTGPVGKRPIVREITDTTQSGVDAMARQLLEIHGGVPEAVTLTTAPSPRFEIGDSARIDFGAFHSASLGGGTTSTADLNLAGDYVIQRVSHQIHSDEMAVTLVPKETV